MIPGSLARRYAKALFALAGSDSERDRFAADLNAFAALCQQKDEAGTLLLLLLASERFPSAERQKLLEGLCRRISAHPMVVRFLSYVLERRRLAGVPQIAKTFTRMADEAGGRARVELTSARPLSPDAVARIQAALAQATGKRIVLTTQTDPELVGGVIAKIGSTVLDGSIRTRLQRLESQLSNG